MKSKFSIIILNYNGTEDTLECVQSIHNSNSKNYKIIIIDNNSKQEEFEKLEKGISKFSNNTILIRSDLNKGFAGGNNLAIPKVDTEFVCFLNNDTVVEESWLDSIEERFENDKTISIIQPKIKSFYKKNFFDYAGGAGGFIDLLGIPFSRGRVGFVVEEDCGQYDNEIDIFWSSGCCFFIRTADLKLQSGFDEDFFLYFEEVDLCYRIKNLGKRIIFYPKSTIYHKGSQSTVRENLNRVYFNHRNSLITLIKNMKFAELILTLPLRFILDIATATFYLLNKNVKSFFSVFKAYLDVIFNLPYILNKRKKLPKTYLWDIQEIKIFSIQIYYQLFNKQTFQDLVGSKKHKPQLLKIYEIKNINFDFIYFIFSLILGIIITNIWFSDSSILYQSGEESLYMFNPNLNVRAFSDGWYQTGYGYSMPIVIPRVPLFIFFDYLKYLGLTVNQLQKYLFLTLLLTGLYSSFKLLKNLTKSNLSAFFGSLFYLFNIFSITQVWGRMLLTNVFLWSFLPLFLYSFNKVVLEKKYIYITLLTASNFLFCYSYGLPSSVIVLWFIPGVILLFNLNKLKEFFIFLISWLLSSIWWLMPYFTLKSEAFKSLENKQAAYDSLLGVSSYFQLEDVIYLHQKFLLKESFNNIYYSENFLWIAKTFLVISILGMLIKFKQRLGYLFSLLFSLFLILGTNTEYGKQFYSFIFDKFTFTQILRNPYEKIGLVFLIMYSLFFGLGITFITNKINNNNFKYLISILTFILLLGYSFPFFNSQVFGFGKIQTKVRYVNRYDEINSLISVANKDKKLRILLYPISEGDGARIKFGETIYNGIDPSEHLYNSTTYSKIVRVTKFDNDYSSLKSVIDLENNKINNQLLDDYHIGYISIDFNYLDTMNTFRDKAVNLLNTSSSFKLIYGQDGIYFYKYLDSKSEYIELKNCNQKITQFNSLSVNRFSVKLDEVFPMESNCKLILKEFYSNNWELLVDGNLIKNKEIYSDKYNAWNLPLNNNKSIEIRFNPYKIQ